MTTLTVYLTSIAATTVTTANKLYIASGASSTTATFVNVGNNVTGYGELVSQGASSGWAAGGSIGSPTGKGYILDNTSLENQQLRSGNWTPSVRINAAQLINTAAGTLTGTITMRAYVRSSGGTYTLIVSSTSTSQTITSTATTYTLPAVAGAAVNLVTGDKLYVDIWFNCTANTNANANQGIQVNRIATDVVTFKGDASVQYVTPGYTPYFLQTKDTLTRFGLTSGATSRVVDAVSRLRVQSGTTYHDALSRFRLLATRNIDALTRFRMQSTQQFKDSVSRFRVQSSIQTKDAQSRFQQQSGLTYHDALSRFRLLSTKSMDVLTRFRVQSGTVYHDVATRFKLASINQRTLDTLSRFRLLATKNSDSLSRFRMQSAQQFKDTQSRFRQQSGTVNHDGNSRFRLLVPLTKDSQARFRQQASGSRDSTQRFRMQQATLLSVLTRFRLQSSLQTKDAQARFKQRSGITKHDALSRYRLLSLTSFNTIMRFCQLARVGRDVHSRFCLFTSVLARDTVARFGLALAPNVTFYVRNGSALMMVRSGSTTITVRSGAILEEVRGI